MDRALAIIFINYLPLTKKYAKDFAFDELCDLGIKVEYFDVTALFFPKLTISDEIERDFVKKITSFDDLYTAIIRAKEKSGETLFIPQVTPEWRTRKILLTLAKSGCRTGFFDVAALPAPQNDNFLTKLASPRSVLRSALNLFTGKLAQLAFYVYKMLHQIKSYDVVFTAGFLSEQRWAGKSSVIVKIHSFDYEEAQKIKYLPTGNPPPEKYAVFLDEYLPEHPDFKMLGMTTVTASHYYNLLRLFFDEFEKIHGMPVIIACHPKSNYADRSDIFGSRKMLHYSTGNLVANSSCVFGHASTAVGYAAMFAKPVIFLTYRELEEKCPGVYALLKSLASSLNSPIVNLENPGDIKPIVSRVFLDNFKKYQEAYIYNFLSAVDEAGYQTNAAIISKWLTAGFE